jgi:Radical SAM superfamily
MKTHSLCHTCYRHIEAELFQRGGGLYLRKLCPEHGDTEVIVENDINFYESILKNRGKFNEQQNVVVLDVTDKCNLTCHHCYHVPDNHSPNKPVQKVLEDIGLTPNDFSIILGGAEPTIRRDIAELAEAVRGEGRSVGVLSNGVRFSDLAVTEQVAPHLDGFVLIGLNHRSYHGETIHAKQLAGLRNLHHYGVRPMLGYTAEHKELPDILNEALGLFQEGVISMIRLRFGASIGRHPDTARLSLSDHLKMLYQVCSQMNLKFQLIHDADNTIYHQMVVINGMPARIIQWPDVQNIVMHELVRAPWAKFIDGPISNFCHQIVLRDGLFNKKIARPDDLPAHYTLRSFLRQREIFNTVPILNVSSVSQACSFDNARYVKKLSGVSVANLHGLMTNQQRKTLVKFWFDTGALQDEKAAIARTEEVIHLGFNDLGEIVAVNTCYKGMLKINDEVTPYWFYRIFVHPRARDVRLSLGLFRLTAEYLGQNFRDNVGPVGIAIHLENPKFYRRSGRRALASVGIKPLGKDDRGVEIWTYSFPDSLSRSRADVL